LVSATRIVGKEDEKYAKVQPADDVRGASIGLNTTLLAVEREMIAGTQF
jgi:hypothetical protein